VTSTTPTAAPSDPSSDPPSDPPHPDVPGRPCSVAAALQLVGERWSLLAIREIFYGNRRFEQMVRNTGAPRDRLAARLRALEEAGIVERRAYSERPLRYEYLLTPAGWDLEPVIRTLLTWGDRWAVDTPPVVFRHHGAGARIAEHAIDSVLMCRTCGEELGTGEDAHDGVTIDVRSPGWSRSGPVED
jgi:DNA-binding HxlR family transcriptional regulator